MMRDTTPKHSHPRVTLSLKELYVYRVMEYHSGQSLYGLWQINVEYSADSSSTLIGTRIRAR